MKNILKVYFLSFIINAIEISPQFSSPDNLTYLKSPLNVKKSPEKIIFEKKTYPSENSKNQNKSIKNQKETKFNTTKELEDVKEIIKLNKKILRTNNTKYFVYLLESVSIIYSIYYSEYIKQKETNIKVLEINFSKRIFTYILFFIIVNQIILNLFHIKNNYYVITTSIILNLIVIINFYNNNKNFLENSNILINISFISICISLLNYIFAQEIISFNKKNIKNSEKILNSKVKKFAEINNENNNLIF
jgi:hypothetical protein